VLNLGYGCDPPSASAHPPNPPNIYPNVLWNKLTDTLSSALDGGFLKVVNFVSFPVKA